MSDHGPFGVAPTRSREDLFGLGEAAIEAAGLSSGVADALAECLVRYEEAITELSAAA